MWLDRALKWLLPREDHFFDFLEHGARCVAESGRLLVECAIVAPDKREALLAQMRDVEHEADRVIVEVYEALNKTFVTPLDRSDIYTLATTLEGITDLIFATLLQISVHALDELPDGSRELASRIDEACTTIQKAVSLLRSMKACDIKGCCKELQRLEHEGDLVFRSKVSILFRTEKDAIKLLKSKEFLEGLEEALDACDDVGNVLDTIVIKNA